MGYTDNTRHRFIGIKRGNKLPELLRLLRRRPKHKTLICVPTYYQALFIIPFLREHGIEPHYVKENTSEASQRFKKTLVNIMVFDDVIYDWSLSYHVINYAKPKSLFTYIRCTELAGRNPDRGIVTTILDGEDDNVYSYIGALYKASGMAVDYVKGESKKRLDPRKVRKGSLKKPRPSETWFMLYFPIQFRTQRPIKKFDAHDFFLSSRQRMWDDYGLNWYEGVAHCAGNNQ